MRKKRLRTRILFLLLTIIICGNNVHAQKLTVWKKGGEKVVYDLNERPTTTFHGNNLIITTVFGSVTYSLSDVVRYTYSNITNEILSVGNDDVHISFKDNCLIINGLKGNEKISVYTMDGKKIFSGTTKSNTWQFPLVNYPYGVYIVKIGSATFKIMKP